MTTVISGLSTPELVIESIIRDGLMSVITDPTIVPMVFAQLTRSYNTAKYGGPELVKIQALVNSKQVAVVYSVAEIEAKSPCFSLVLGSEDQGQALLGDYAGAQTIPGTPQSAIVIPNVQPNAYNATTGMISVPDSVDLSTIYPGLLFIDSTNLTHVITGGINNATGAKSFFVGPEQEVSLAGPGTINTPFNYTFSELNQVPMRVQIVVGVHAKDALTAKYLYMLLKYFIISREADLITRGFNLQSFTGSDFTRMAEFQADKVYSRSLTLSGLCYDSWSSNISGPIDQVIIDAIPEASVEES
jgi:hypothetical protein